jgi:hypothetical protein
MNLVIQILGITLITAFYALIVHRIIRLSISFIDIKLSYHQINCALISRSRLIESFIMKALKSVDKNPDEETPKIIETAARKAKEGRLQIARILMLNNSNCHQSFSDAIISVIEAEQMLLHQLANFGSKITSGDESINCEWFETIAMVKEINIKLETCAGRLINEIEYYSSLRKVFGIISINTLHIPELDISDLSGLHFRQ